MGVDRAWLDIEKDTALFYSDVKISVGPYDTIKKIEGWVSVNYDKDINKIILKIEEAKVILDINILGKKIVLSELDIASYFSTPFKLNGPEPIASNIEYKLPNGEIRKVSCKTSFRIVFSKDAIQVSTSLDLKNNRLKNMIKEYDIIVFGATGLMKTDL